MHKFETVVLKPGKESSLLRFHPWVFSGAVKYLPATVREGEPVRVVSAANDFLGLGHYQVGSIAVRIFSFKEQVTDREFWKHKISNALEVREASGFCFGDSHNICRLIHGEGDGLPGLIVDYYNGVAVMQAHSAGMYLIRQELAAALREVLGSRLTAVYDKSEKTVPFKANLSPVDGYLYGSAILPHMADEYGLHFNIDWISGQKTGFFIDQRENRRLLERYSRGMNVLNMFCYSGGFSAYALRGGAALVHSVDSSAKAVELTLANMELNFQDDSRHKAFSADAFEFLRDAEPDYDLIILDPPAFAKHQDALPQALKAYKRINARAMQIIRPGGILFTFSCSQSVPRDKFREAVFSAAAISGRSVRILHQLTQPADHPVSIYHPEGEYLKGLVLFVE